MPPLLSRGQLSQRSREIQVLRREVTVPRPVHVTAVRFYSKSPSSPQLRKLAAARAAR